MIRKRLLVGLLRFHEENRRLLFLQRPVTVNGLAERIAVGVCSVKCAVQFINELISKGFIKKADGFVSFRSRDVTNFYEEFFKEEDVMNKIIYGGKYNMDLLIEK